MHLEILQRRDGYFSNSLYGASLNFKLVVWVCLVITFFTQEMFIAGLQLENKLNGFQEICFPTIAWTH
jgi:hypothetical protein